MKPIELELERLVYMGSRLNQYQIVEEEAPDILSSLECNVCPACDTPFEEDVFFQSGEITWQCPECGMFITIDTIQVLP